MHSVSVVVPTFNRADLIAETIDSILRQTVKCKEIIVVDDGSTDKTQDLIAEYRGAVQYIIIENSGELVARNTGLAKSSGSLVAFCDSDDLWKPDHVAECIKAWDIQPNCRVCYSNFNVVTNGSWQDEDKFGQSPARFWEGSRDIDGHHKIFDEPIVKNIIQFQPFFPSAMVVDRDFFQRTGGWDEGVSRMVGCDFATTLRVAEYTPIAASMLATVGIRKHSSNFSGNTEKMNLGDADVLEYVLCTRPSLEKFRPHISASIVRRRLEALESAFARHDFSSVRDISRRLPASALTWRSLAKSLIARSPSSIGNMLKGPLQLVAGARDKLRL